VVRKIIAKHTR